MSNLTFNETHIKPNDTVQPTNEKYDGKVDLYDVLVSYLERFGIGREADKGKVDGICQRDQHWGRSWCRSSSTCELCYWFEEQELIRRSTSRSPNQSTSSLPAS